VKKFENPLKLVENLLR